MTIGDLMLFMGLMQLGTNILIVFALKALKDIKQELEQIE